MIDLHFSEGEKYPECIQRSAVRPSSRFFSFIIKCKMCAVIFI